MSIAQQPRRVGRVNSRIKTGQDGVNQYGGQNVPVLLRLPACSFHSSTAAAAVQLQDTSLQDTSLQDTAQQDAIQHDRGPSKRDRTRNGASSRGRRPLHQPESGVNTKIVAGGVLVGIVIACLLFFTNGGGSDQADEVAWPEENSEGLQVVVPEGEHVPEAVADFNYELETVEAQPMQPEAIDTMTAPDLADVPAHTSEAALPGGGGLPGESTVAGSSVTASWNEEPSTPLHPGEGAASTTNRIQSWPETDFTDTSSGADHRSTNSIDNGVYRTGRRLEQNASPGDNILDGTIEIPTQTSLR